MQIFKCDRCRKEIVGYKPIIFQFINQNEFNNKIHPMFGVLQEFNHFEYELCGECAKNVLRWLSHPENELERK